jgi:putative transcriptional regulator
MTQERLLQQVISVLLSAGFEVSDRFTMRPRSFDLVASNSKVTLVIKVVSQIDSISEEIACDLDAVARSIHGSPLIIGERARDAELERGVVYVRYGDYAISVATLHDYFVDRIPPLVYASPGGLYVTLDGEALRSVREERRMSLGDLSQQIGVSRRTISKYESGMGTTLEIALRIEEIYDRGLVQPIDILQENLERTVEDRLENSPMAFLEGLGLKLHMMRRAPFQALLTFREAGILTGYGPAQKVEKRALLINNISQIAHMRAMCILTDYDKQKRVGRTLLIGERRLHRLESGADLLDLIDS